MAEPINLALSDLMSVSENNQCLLSEPLQNSCFNPPLSKELCENRDQYQSHEPDPIFACIPPSMGAIKLFQNSTPLLFQSSMTGVTSDPVRQLISTISTGLFLLITMRADRTNKVYHVAEATPDHQIIFFTVQTDDQGKIINIEPVKTRLTKLKIEKDPKDPEVFIFTLNKHEYKKPITFAQRLRIINPFNSSDQKRTSYVAFDQVGNRPAVVMQNDSSFSSPPPFSSPRIEILQEMEFSVAQAKSTSEISCKIILLSDHSIAIIYFNKNNKTEIIPGSLFYPSSSANSPLELVQEIDGWSVQSAQAEEDSRYRFKWKNSHDTVLKIIQPLVISARIEREVPAEAPITPAAEPLALCLPPSSPPWSGTGTPEGLSSPEILERPALFEISGWSESLSHERPKEIGKVKIQYLGIDKDKKYHFLLSVVGDKETEKRDVYLVVSRKGTYWEKVTFFFEGEEVPEPQKLYVQGKTVNVLIKGKASTLKFDPKIFSYSIVKKAKRSPQMLKSGVFIIPTKTESDAIVTSTQDDNLICVEPPQPAKDLSKKERSISLLEESRMLKVDVWQGRSLNNSEYMMNVNLYYLWSESDLRHYSLVFDNGVEVYLIVRKNETKPLEIVHAYIKGVKVDFKKEEEKSTWSITDQSIKITLNTVVLSRVLNRSRDIRDMRFFLFTQIPSTTKPRNLQSIPVQVSSEEVFRKELRKITGSIWLDPDSLSDELFMNLESLAAANPNQEFYETYLNLKNSRFDRLVLYGFAKTYADIHVPEGIFSEGSSRRDLFIRAILGSIVDSTIRGSRQQSVFREREFEKLERYLASEKREKVEFLKVERK